MKPSVLIIDDETAMRFAYSAFLGECGYAVAEAGSLAEARRLASERRFDAVLLDVWLPDGNGVSLIPELRQACPSAVLVVVTGMGDIPLAVEAITGGADNFMTKPVNFGSLEAFLKKAIEAESLRRKDQARRVSPGGRDVLGQCRSAAMVACMETASAAARGEAPVLILGETGTGKSVLARWLHENGPRAKGPFVEVNCSSLRGEVLASELFGHARGAFTGAVKDHEGLVSYADGGTLFLDEVGDMDLRVQATMLKVIEEKTYRRIGETRTRFSDFRLLSATNHDIVDEVGKGSFRQDFFYRLNVISVSIPPLRERARDLPGIVSEILVGLGIPPAAVSPGVIDALSRRPWPGNVRELRNAIERAVMLRRDAELTPEMFYYVDERGPRSYSPVFSGRLPAAEPSEADLRAVVERTGGNREEMAWALGISRATLYRKMKRLGMV